MAEPLSPERADQVGMGDDLAHALADMLASNGHSSLRRVQDSSAGVAANISMRLRTRSRKVSATRESGRCAGCSVQ